MSKQPLDYETPRPRSAKTASPVVRQAFAVFFVLMGAGSLFVGFASLWLGRNPLQSAVTMQFSWGERAFECASGTFGAIFCFVLAHLIWPNKFETPDPTDPPPA